MNQNAPSGNGGGGGGPEAIITQLMKVLAANDLTPSARVVAEVCGDLGTNSIVRGLRRLGVEPRLVRLRVGDLAFTPVGSLVWLDDSVLAFVSASSPSGVRLELGTGETKTLSGAALDAVQGHAIIVRRKGAAGRSFTRRVWALARKEPRFSSAIVLVLLMSLFGSLFGVASPMLSRIAINDAIPSGAPSKLLAVALGTLLLFAHSAWAGWIRRRCIMFIEAKLGDLGVEEIVRHMLGLPFQTLDKLEIGQVLEYTRTAEGLALSVMTLATALLDTVFAFAYLAFVFWLDPWAGGAVTLGALLLVSAGLLRGKRTFELRQAILDTSRAQKQALVETIAGMETVKSEVAEERMLVRYLKRLLMFQNVTVKDQMENSVFSVVTLSIDRLVYGIILVVLAGRVLRGESNVGDLMAAIQASSSFFASAQMLARLPNFYYTIAAQGGRLDEILRIGAEPLEAPERSNVVPEGRDAVVLRDVWFRYDAAAPWVLQGLTVTVPSGSTVVLEWPSGAGKSTLLRMVSGLIKPERGDVLLFGREAARARHLVTYLPQHASLLPMSIMDNLRTLSGNAAIERIVQAARATKLTEVVKAWPMGFDTLIATGGANISSGQRQLVLFTAALASPAPVLLLDEAFAHMDALMRSELAHLDLMKGRTIIAVVHDATSRERGAATMVLGQGGGAAPAKARPILSGP